MRSAHTVFAGFAAAALTVAVAQAQSLTVVEVNAPAVNCVFNASCRVTVNDSTGVLPMPFVLPGTAWLQSRTYTGAPGTPAAGQTAYEYRLSLTQASGQGECIAGLVLNFGPVTKLPYAGGGTLADVFVVTTGGLGTIGIASAQKTGNIIEFTFKNGGLCLNGGPDIKNTTFFFGLAAATPPTTTSAHLWAVGSPPFYEVPARVPTH